MSRLDRTSRSDQAIRLQSTAWPDSTGSLDLDRLTETASAALTTIESRIAYAPTAAELVRPLTRHTAGRTFAGLGALAAVEVTLARVVEPHLDAIAILAQAQQTQAQQGQAQQVQPPSQPLLESGESPADAQEQPRADGRHHPVADRTGATSHTSRADRADAQPQPAADHADHTDRHQQADATWGVFAAEGPGVRLDATQTADGWRLTGTKPWCSLASRLSDALVTAHTGPDERRLFAVHLGDPGVTTDDSAWLARGLPLVASAPVGFDAVPASPVGDDGWYLQRPGFAWGGIGVAACWWGGAIPLVDRLLEAARSRPDAELLLRTLGAAAVDLSIAENTIAEAARAIEQGAADGVRGSRLAQAVRSTVRGRVDAIRAGVLAALGPAPLTTDAAYLSRLSDLELYVQQDHGDRDLARYGRMLVEAS